MDGGAWWAAVHGVAKSRTRLSVFTFTSHFHALEKEMAAHSSVLAWRIPGMGEPGGLPSMGSHRVRHDWSDLAAAAAATADYQFSSGAQLCPTLCDPMNRSTPGLPVRHQLPEFTQTHAHRVGDTIQPSHPLSSPSPPAPNPSQHQGLFQWVTSSQQTIARAKNSWKHFWNWGIPLILNSYKRNYLSKKEKMESNKAKKQTQICLPRMKGRFPLGKCSHN